MKDAEGEGFGESRRRRADAERSIAAILDAAMEVLPVHPQASMAAIGRAAGVARATIYMHFPTRESLIEAVTKQAVDEVTRVVAAQEPERGPANEALVRVVAAAWAALGRFHVLVALNSELPPPELNRRLSVLTAQISPLIERGQRSGVFRADVPASWHRAVIVALVHAASAEMQAGRLSQEDVPGTLTTTLLAAVSPRDSR